MTGYASAHHRRCRSGASGRRLLAAVLPLWIAFLFLAPSSEAGGTSTGDALLLLRVENIDELWAFVEEYEEAGAQFPHVYPPDLLIGNVPPSVEELLRGDFRVSQLHRRPAPILTSKSAQSEKWNLVIEGWNRETEEEAPAPAKSTEEFHDLLLIPPDPSTLELPKTGNDPIGEKTYGTAYGASFFQTSEWLLGKVAVGVVLPSAEGARYTDAQISDTYRAVRGAMDFWASQVSVIPGVRFVYNLQAGIPTNRNFASLAPSYNEKEWIYEIFGEMGYDLDLKGSNHGPIYEYLDTLRTQYQTEWAYCAFIPKAYRFPAGYLAYAYLGGPYLACPSGVNGLVGTGSMALSDLIIHESGHIFWALDEYASGGTSSPCHAQSGYLGWYNRNSMNRDYYCDPVHKPCCMEKPARAACKHTLAQMAVYDEPNDEGILNGIPEVLDTDPWVSVDTLPDTITTAFPVLNGHAAVMPKINMAEYLGTGMDGSPKVTAGRGKITFNTIDHVIYRIDDEVDEEGKPLWRFADPEGGWGGDSTLVHFSFVPEGLTGGQRKIVIKGENSVGNQSNAWGKKEINVFVKAIAVHDFIAEPTYDGEVHVSFQVRGGAFDAQAELYRRDDETGTETKVATFGLNDDEGRVIEDSLTRPGVSYTYRLTASALGMSWDWETPAVAPAPLKYGEHLSQVTPNPFHSSTLISVKVPRGKPSQGGGTYNPKPGGTSGTTPPPVSDAPQLGQAANATYREVRVELDIYNVAGRRVRHFDPVHAREGFLSQPFEWDGTDDSGRRLAAGLYFVRLKAGDDVLETRKVMLLR